MSTYVPGTLGSLPVGKEVTFANGARAEVVRTALGGKRFKIVASSPAVAARARAAPRVARPARRSVSPTVLRRALQHARPSGRSRVTDLSRKGNVKDLSTIHNQRLFYRDPVAFVKKYDVKGFDDGSRAGDAKLRKQLRRDPRGPATGVYARRALSPEARAKLARNAAKARAAKAQRGGFWW